MTRVLLGFVVCSSGVVSAAPAVNLRESTLPSPVRSLAAGDVELRGAIRGGARRQVMVRVTTSFGQAFTANAVVANERFAARYPRDFAGAPPLSPSLLYIDATDAPSFGGKQMLDRQAEAVLIVAGATRETLPDLPAPFTDDLVDALGATDDRCAQWRGHRALVNLYVRSRGAKLARIGRPYFDLDNANDFDWFRGTLTLYDYDHRDRDWSRPLANRVAAGFWQAGWNTWFGRGNDHPWDGDVSNPAQDNYRPYAFTSDHAALLVLYQMRRSLRRDATDNRDKLCEGALANLLAMQHRESTSLALKQPSGRRERYTAGAFHYGMFESGEWLTEGTGWFADAARHDHRGGGVFNGRAAWALGESLKAEPHGRQASAVRRALGLALRFCLGDALAHGYARRTQSGHVFWRDAGEHGYLLLGMLAAVDSGRDVRISLDDASPPRALDSLCADALDALVDEARNDGGWTEFPDQDAMAIAALADGARVFAAHPSSRQWLAAATSAADVWLSLPTVKGERAQSTPHFGVRKDGRMSHVVAAGDRLRFTFYVSGHWLHALAKLHGVTREPRYLRRCESLLAYLCGANPFHARLFNELGAVYNYVDDSDADGTEDTLQYDLYPESTAFVQIGLLHFLTRR